VIEALAYSSSFLFISNCFISSLVFITASPFFKDEKIFRAVSLPSVIFSEIKNPLPSIEEISIDI
jgi:hypothetical protein